MDLATPTVFRSRLPAPACDCFSVATCGPTSPWPCHLDTVHLTTQAAARGCCFHCRTLSSSVRKERRRAAFNAFPSLNGTSRGQRHCPSPRDRGSKGEMPNESFSADRCRCSLCIGGDADAAECCDASGAASSCRCTNRRYRSGARRPWPWSRAYGARRSWTSLRLGQGPRASLRMDAWQTSRMALKAGTLKQAPPVLNPGGLI
jgi:hypothetical protein